MSANRLESSETAIMSRVVQPKKPNFPAAAARAILEWDFSSADKKRMHELSAKAQEGNLTDAEQSELDNFERVGHLLNLMQSKARLSLKSRQNANGKAKTH